ncbi:MAG: serine hydrolase domain-containing protein [Kordiimonas sp.]
MTINSKFRGFITAALFCSVSGFAAVSAEDSISPTAEATAVEAELSFWDLTPLEKAFIDTSPAARDDAFPVGELGVDGGEKSSIVALAKEIAEGKYGKYDSLLITQKDKLLFESYFQRGRINLAHGQASATKVYTAMILGRAMQLGYLTMADLKKPIIDFLDDLDRTKLVDGAERITLHKAMTMHSGIRLTEDQRKMIEENSEAIKGQGLVQAWLEATTPITDETQTYLYSFDPDLVMTVIDAVAPGTAKDFIKTEVLDKLAITNYNWGTNVNGLPQAGWMVSMTSRDMLKWGSVILNEGKWNGEQLIPAEYLAVATKGLVKPTQDWMPESYRYGYYFYQTSIAVGGKSYNATFAWGGGDQRIIVVDALDLVVVFTGHDNEGTMMDQVVETVLPAFAK